LQTVKLGLRVGARGPELAVLDIQDSIGQRSVLTFTAFEVNPVLASDVFQFKPPAGSDVVRP
jgi:outer membrane lipoprotein carrier protein